MLKPLSSAVRRPAAATALLTAGILLLLSAGCSEYKSAAPPETPAGSDTVKTTAPATD